MVTVNVEFAAEAPVIWADVAEHDASAIVAGTEQVSETVPVHPATGVMASEAVCEPPGDAIDRVGPGDGNEKSWTEIDTVFVAVV